MKYLLSFALGCALTLSLGFVFQSSKPLAYEYKILRSLGDKEEKQVNELGAQGWELIHVLPVLDRGSTIGVDRADLYFRRAKH